MEIFKIICAVHRMDINMKKNAFANKILLWGFLCLMLLPFLLFAIFENYIDTKNYENRTLAEFPSFENTNLQEFPSQFENYLGDNAPFRNQFMTLNAAINMMFGIVNSSDVLLGEENWLFLKDVSDSKSISDFQGLTSYSEEQKQQVAQQINELQSILNERQIELVIVFAPAKEGVYSNYMPSYIPVINEQSRVEALVLHLEQNTNVPVVFPKDSLINAAKSADVYFKYDTHWNEIGAYIAAQEVYKAMGFNYNSELPEYEQIQVEEMPQDLANISATWAIFNEDVYYSVLQDAAKITKQSDDKYLTHYSGTGEGGAIMITDSFGEMLTPFLSAQFKKSIAIHSTILSSDNLQMAQDEIATSNSGKNYLIIEVAERFSDTLLPKLEMLNEYY